MKGTLVLATKEELSGIFGNISNIPVGEFRMQFSDGNFFEGEMWRLCQIGILTLKNGETITGRF